MFELVSALRNQTDKMEIPETNQRVILLLDMDAFYASIEQRDNPALMAQPVIVGYPPPRSVVATASREARKAPFKIHSGMPMVMAKRQCPHGHFVVPRMDYYREESRKIMGLVTEVAGPSAIIETVGLDEAYVDLTEVCQGSNLDASLDLAIPVARAMKQLIVNERKLTCTVGISSNKMLAKLASDQQKPDGLTVIHDQDKLAITAPLPVTVLAGVGEKTALVLDQKAGVKTVNQLRDFKGDLCAIVGNVLGTKLPQLALGNDLRAVVPNRPPRCINREETFPKNVSDVNLLGECLKRQAQRIAMELTKQDQSAATIILAICEKFPKIKNRQKTFAKPIFSADDLFGQGLKLLVSHASFGKSVRRLGLSVTNLSPRNKPAQP
jgi:DNA polymerase IV